MKVLLYGAGDHYLDIIHYFSDKGYYVHIDADQKKNRPHYDVIISPSGEQIQARSMGEMVREDSSYLSQAPKVVTESIIADLLLHTSIADKSIRIAIIGYGETGKKLTYALTSLGHDVHVCVDTEEEAHLLEKYGISTFYTTSIEERELLKSMDTIINTKQICFLTDEHLSSLGDHTYILDVFSEECQVPDYIFANRDITYKKIYTDLSNQTEAFEPEKTLSIHLHTPYSNSI